MAREGHEVTVVTSRYDPSLPVEEHREGYRIVRGKTWGVLFNTPIDPGVGTVLRSMEADVLHLHFPPPLTSYFAVRAIPRRHPPIALTYHCDLYLPGVGGRLLTGLYQRVFLPRVLNRSNRIIVHTQSYGSTSAPLRGRNLTVIPSVVDVNRFRPGLGGPELRKKLALEDKRVLAFAGRLVPHKGVDVLLRVLPVLPADVVLLVIGSGPRLRTLINLSRRLGIRDRVRFLSDVSDEEFPRLLSVADLFVYPALNRLEGFGLAVAESMASGLPVVITDMPGVREVIEPGREGLLVEPLLQGDLAQRLRELLDDPERRRRMGIAARRRAEERYALPAVVRSLITLYEGLTVTG